MRRNNNIASRYEVIEKPLACIKKLEMNKSPQSDRLIRRRLAGFEVTGDIADHGRYVPRQQPGIRRALGRNHAVEKWERDRLDRSGRRPAGQSCACGRVAV
jgi:hypothetical protein